ncbi:MAG: hypothetical protein M1414_02405 [Candidatus Thermoplasmatota archaeon]|nr:hypothetical protein [Candidatus Thermoplasmatota archaeon]MCL5987739.1 hypothetical protein [Candidatus Thermoplasmatota archaeon]
MDRNRIYQLIFNFMIMFPPIAMFAYAAPMEFQYWLWFWPFFIIVPVAKFFVPERFQSSVYPLVLMVVLIYMAVGFIRQATGYSYFPVNLDNFTTSYIGINFFFTIGTAVVFPICFEGVMTKNVQRSLAYMVWASALTIYFITAVAISPYFTGASSSSFNSGGIGLPLLKASGFLYAYEITGDLIYINIYLLITQGYEFITLILKPSPTIMNLLIVSFIISLMGFILRLRFSNTPSHRPPLEVMAYPLLIGGVGGVAVTLLVTQLQSTYYGFLVITLILLVLTIYTKSLDRKSINEIKITDDDVGNTS